jgi:uroporphyrinogen III methyltransferase / synthase
MEQTREKSPDGEQVNETVEASSSKPLSGKAVLVTRARQQSEEMTAMLEELGAKVIHAPMIEMKEPDRWDAVDQAINQLAVYDWIIFTSANGVKFFFQRLSQNRRESLSEISGASVCAIGAATAKALESVGVNIDFIPMNSTAEGLMQELLDHLGGSDALGGLRFLLPRARLAREVLPDALRRFGAQVDVVEAYQNVTPEMDSESILHLLQDEGIDVITFTSSSTVHNFAALIGKAHFSALLQNSLIACIGPITRATAEEYHLQNVIEPDRYTAEALVQAIVQAISSEQ